MRKSIKLAAATLLAVTGFTAPALAWDHHGHGHFFFYSGPAYSYYPYAVYSTYYAPPPPPPAYAAAPLPVGQDNGYCREYQSVVRVGGARRVSYGTACLQPDGSWKIMN